MDYRELKKAIALFGLGERATLNQIKARHRDLAKTHHPDHGEPSAPEMIREINSAYELLCDYCQNYRFSFSEEEFLEQHPEERLRRQFGWDPVWSGQEESTEDE